MLLEAGGIDDIQVPGYERARREQGQLWEKERGEVKGDAIGNGKGRGKQGEGLTAQVTEDIREWDYGAYEGITSKEIKKMRQEKGEKEWEIWRDGCPDGEYVFYTSNTPYLDVPKLNFPHQIPRTNYHPPRPPHLRNPHQSARPSTKAHSVRQRRRRTPLRRSRRRARTHSARVCGEVDRKACAR